jgi:hypothetical protein
MASDVRAKYSAKLRQKLESGGISSIDRAKQIDLIKGDAEGHLRARAMAVSQGSSSNTKWMALTGTGALLQYISNRSISIVLLPLPEHPNKEEQEKRMKEFAKQLPQVRLDLILHSEHEEDKIWSVEEVLKKLPQDNSATLLVSDRSDYLNQAKALGMTTCGIRPPNTPRGTAHYVCADMSEVQQVLNQVNGISFAATRK